ncbi:ATP-binding protein [Neptunicella marina]|uniref:histidine kinase n=1 Tax=Neptunicella marina TaxID=2125989 RepID=A0A8J6M0F3_9ALTE|nr:ATP-binding protein [Neptunicella marina]
MKKLSLKRRSTIAALIVVFIFIPLTALTLEQAFVNSLTQSMYQQLSIQNLGLISEFELEDGEVHMPQLLFNEQFNLPDSGTYAFINMHLIPAWQSASSIEWKSPPVLEQPAVGDEIRQVIILDNEEYFQYSYTAEFEDNDLYFPITFHILQSKTVFNMEVSNFRQTLWYWMGMIAFFLIFTLVFSLSAALQPIGHLIKQLQKIEQGQSDNISGHYPTELEHLKSNINHLLAVEQKQRLRYQHSLSDLAHSLKTPLAVLTNMQNMPSDANAPLQQIKNQIERQLKRAVGGKGTGWKQAVDVPPVLNQLVNAMHKVYQHKSLSISLKADKQCRFLGDKTDLLELLGNVIDNACKAARHKVQIAAQQNENQLLITVEDDGPGIPLQQREAMMDRGARLDTYGEGQGIGMAIVADLLYAYDGQFDVTESILGGARIILTFDS